VKHRRGVLRLGDEGWLVLDALKSADEHSYRLHWLFPDGPYEWDEATGEMTLHTLVGSYFIRMATLSGEGTYSVIRADEHTPRGWRAPYYSYREPALSVDMVLQAKTELFWTLFGSEPCHVIIDRDTIRINGNQWRASIVLQTEDGDQSLLIASVSMAGALTDRLEIA
jgi:hypothetical protein